MMMWKREFKEKWLRWFRELAPCPLSGSLWRDTWSILLLIALQTTVLPSLLPEHLLVDLLVPWLLFIFVAQPAYKTILLTSLAALGMETHLSVPSGLYLCSFGIFAIFILFLRHHISWRRPISWAVMFALFELWVICLENFFTAVRVGGWDFLTVTCIFSGVLRVAIGTVIGLILLDHFSYLLLGQAHES